MIANVDLASPVCKSMGFHFFGCIFHMAQWALASKPSVGMLQNITLNKG